MSINSSCYHFYCHYCDEWHVPSSQSWWLSANLTNYALSRENEFVDPDSGWKHLGCQTVVNFNIYHLPALRSACFWGGFLGIQERISQNKLYVVLHFWNLQPAHLTGIKALHVASLVVQWLRICLPMQGTRVRALVWEDPTCRGAAGPVSHNYWACASGACAPQQERPAHRDEERPPLAATRESPRTETKTQHCQKLIN